MVRTRRPCFHVFDREVALVEVLVHQLFVRLGRGLQHLLAPLRGLVSEIGGDVAQLELGALGAVVPVDSLHPHQIDDPFELVFGADGKLDRHRVRLQARLNLLIHAQKICARAIHLVHEAQARDAVLVCLPPHRLGLRLHPAHRAQHGAGAVEHAQAALHFDREVHVAGRVDDVDAVLGQRAVHPLPEARRGSGRDGDAAFLLLLHPVHDGGAVVHLAQLVRYPGVEKDALGGRGLAGIDVRHDADVPVMLNGCLACHGLSTLLLIAAARFWRAALVWLPGPGMGRRPAS